MKTALTQVIAKALPRRLQATRREYLTNVLGLHIGRRLKELPWIEDHERRKSDLARLADSLRRKLEKTSAELKGRRHRLAEETQEAIASRTTPTTSIKGLSLTWDLHNIVLRALQELDEWDERKRARARQPRKRGPDLAQDLHILCAADQLSSNEFATLLGAINDAGIFPDKLDAEAVRTRRRRSK